MGVKIAEKLEQFNNGTYYLVDSSAVEYIDKDGNTKSVKEALDGTLTDTSTHKTIIFENQIDMGKYLLLAKIIDANYSNNIIKFSCPNYKGANDVGFKYENDMDIYKFELHFNTGSRRETNSYGVTLKQHGLGLYSYPLNNPQNTEPKIEEAIRLYWDYNKGEIYVFLVDMMTAIPHCVLEYTGSGTLLKENTFVMDDLYNRREGLNGTWEESKWKSIPYNKLEIPPIHELGGDGGSAEGTTTYTSLSELGLTAPVSVGEIFNAMPDNTMAMIGCEDIADHITDVPMSYGVLTIKKSGVGRFSIEYQNSLQGSACNVKRWIGTLKGIDGTGLYWKEVQTEIGVVITSDIIAKYGTEILKYPVGTWRIDSVNIGKQFTDLPYTEMAGIIEIDSIQPNKSPYEHSYGYRNYTFKDALNNTVYTRSLNSGNTAGTLNRDSGWCTTGSHFYNLSQMYLSASATFQDVIDALPTGCSALLGVKEFTNYQTIFPYEEGNDQFARVHIVKGTADGSIVYARWFRKDGVKEAIANFNISDNKFSGWQLLKNRQTFISLTELGLTADATIQDVIDALPIGNTAILRTDGFTNWSTLFNGIQWGYLKIEKTVNGLSNIELQEVISPNRRYFGSQSSGKFNAWEKIPSDTRVTTLETQVNELFQSVSNGKTSVANAITGKGVSTSTTATFATMATNISKISSYKEETKSFPVPMTGSTTITSTFSADVLGIKQIILPTDSSRLIPQATLESFKIEGKNVTMTITGVGTWKVTALIKA